MSSSMKWVSGKFVVLGRASARQGATVEVPVDATDEQIEQALREKAKQITPQLGRLVEGPTRAKAPRSGS